MEDIKSLTEAAGHFLSDGQSETNWQPSSGTSPTTPPPPSPAVLEAEDQFSVLVEENDGLKTPTSALNKIQPFSTCPPAPRKPKATPLRKRKGSYRELRLLDMSTDVLSLYPPALLADFGNKLKKTRGDKLQQQNKENIFSNINSSSA